MSVKRYLVDHDYAAELSESEPSVSNDYEDTYVLASDHEATLADLRASYEREIQTWYDKLQAADATVIELDRRIAELEWECSDLRQVATLTIRERDALQRDAAIGRDIQELCGSVADGSDTTVRIHQDDATRTWHIDVALDSYWGDSLRQALDAAIDAQLAPVGGASDGKEGE